MSSDIFPNPKVWQVAPVDEALEAEFTRSLPVSQTLCRVLINRGIRTVSDAQRFLIPDLNTLHDPRLMDGIDIAVARTKQALESGEKIMVHGDYDVDGITSTALLVRVLRILQADVSWYLPHRQKEGYDIGIPAVDTAAERGVGLIITVDCGTSAVEAAEYARSKGIDMIVTDHHEIGAEVANAYVVVNPRKPECRYPFKDLAGVGVAFKFAEALIAECGYDVATYRRRFSDLAAIGTVADVVPLLDENRVLVKVGMEELPRTGKKGLRSLMSIAGVTGRTITSHHLAFALAPRLNAAGRVDDASVALELLLTTDEQEAEQLAQNLDAHNKARQAEQERITREALEQIESRGIGDTAKVLVLSSKGWHPGIVGIVASKITEKYSRPSVLVAMDDTGEAGVGSARSTGVFDLFEALMQCRHLLERCGGHARAAGLSVTRENLAEFDAAINTIADELLSEADLLPQVEVDAELDLDAVTYDLARELELLEPHGHYNRQPIFMSRNALVLQKTTMGADRTHLRLKLGTHSGRPVECVAFGWGECEAAFRVGALVDLCYNIRINQYGGTQTIQTVLRDARASDAAITEPFPGGNIA